MSAIKPIRRLRKIAASRGFESAIDSIVTTCQQIGNQSQDYISQSIDPELGRMVPERDRLKSQLDKANAEIEKTKYRGVPVWLARQARELKAQIQVLNSAIRELKQQERELIDYIKTVNSISIAS